MPRKKPAPASKTPRSKPKAKDKSLVVIQCEAAVGNTPCAHKALAAEVLMEALAATVWIHRDDSLESTEFVIHDTSIVPTKRGRGHFEVGVEVVRLDDAVYAEDTMEMTLQKFLQTFVPKRNISVQDYQA